MVVVALFPAPGPLRDAIKPSKWITLDALRVLKYARSYIENQKAG